MLRCILDLVAQKNFTLPAYECCRCCALSISVIPAMQAADIELGAVVGVLNVFGVYHLDQCAGIGNVV